MVALGIDVLFQQRRQTLSGKHVGLVTNYNVTDSEYRPIIQRFAQEPSWRLEKLFGPEHGVWNCAKEGEEVQSNRDDYTGLPVYSLFGESYKPTPDMLSHLDVLVIDLPDVGSRYYTNMSTLALCIDACAENHIPCIVLDRPNPIGGTVREGNFIDSKYKSFVGFLDIPNRHGLTMGELAMFHNHTLDHPAELEIVTCEGWRRSMWQQDTGTAFVSPSPNLASLDMLALYPGTCLFEGTNISEGRGTTHPFEVIGAPYMNAFHVASAFNERGIPGVVARPTYFVPTYKKYVGEVCQGVQFHITDRYRLPALKVGLALLDIVTTLYPDEFQFMYRDDQGRYFFDLLAGTNRLRELVVAGRTMDFEMDCESDLERFEKTLADVLLYDV